MKVLLLLPLAVVVTVGLIGFMNMRQKQQNKEAVRSRFQDIKLRVTQDMLEEFQKEGADITKQLDDGKKEQTTLEEAAKDLQSKVDSKKSEADACQGGQKAFRDELASAETAFNDLKAETDKEAAAWKTELDTLKQKINTRSPVCDHLKTESEAASKLCNAEEPKAEAPKEEVKAEAPKQEEAQAEAPKQEAQAEAPKQEAQAEAPKQEEAKAEAPKKR